MKKLHFIAKAGVFLFLVVNFTANAANISTRILGTESTKWVPISINGTLSENDLYVSMDHINSVTNTRLNFWVTAYKDGVAVWRGNKEILENGQAINSCTPNTKTRAAEVINQYLSRGITIGEAGSGVPGINGQFDTITAGAAIVCRSGGLYTPGSQYTLGDKDTTIVNPPYPPPAVCSLSNNVNLSYSSSTLNVNGLSQNASLGISCTNGTAKDYTLRLTGNNISNGRLVFGNGITAQVYLNGAAVSANGAGISLNSLTSRSIPIRADLIGTATNSGTITANGVLILDAL